MVPGVHGAVVRGFAAALEEAASLGLGVLQMLPYRRHQEPTEEDFADFARLRRERKVSRLIIHARFVPSLCSSDAARRRASVEHLARELALAARWGAESFILHAGAFSPGSSAAEGLRLFAQSAREAAGRAGGVTLVVENVPGGGRRLGGTLEELSELLAALRRSDPKAGVCLDTAHAWAAGYDLSSAEGALRFLARVHKLLGADSVRAFHLNDSRAKLGSHREDHAHWGEGYLGPEGLKVLLDRPEYAQVPAILETPKGPGADRRNLDYLTRLSARP